MRKHPLMSCALIALVLGVASQSALAQSGPDPAEIAQACIQQVHSAAQARAERNAAIAANCVVRVHELLEAGEIQQAHIAAARCIERIRHRSRDTALHIRIRCHQCRHVLLFLGAPGLAHAVQEACEDAVLVVQVSKATAIATVRSALPDP